MSFRRSTLLCSLLILATACSDVAGPAGRVVLTNPSFATDINEIFQRRGCSASSCHGDEGGRAGLELTADAAANYAELVNVPAVLEDYMRVLPGDADASYLVIKIEGMQMAGQQMPVDSVPLDDIDRSNIRNWIGKGAPNN